MQVSAIMEIMDIVLMGSNDKPDVFLLEAVDILSVKTLFDQQRIKLFQFLLSLENPFICIDC